MGKLAGKVALITGAGQGVGLGIAQAFASQGASVVITGRDAQRLEHAAPLIEQRGGKALACPGDASKRENAEQAVKTAVEAFGGLDILVNNAQARRSGVPFEEITEDDMELALGSGPVATLLHMQAAFPHMKEKGGSIINFGSKMGMLPIAGIASYAAAKEAIRGLTRSAGANGGATGSASTCSIRPRSATAARPISRAGRRSLNVSAGTFRSAISETRRPK